MPNEAEKAAIVAKYTEESSTDDAQYSPLQCAAYNCDREAIPVLLETYAQNGTLAQELSYHAGKFGETILHIAIKDPNIFAQCCDALTSIGLFEQTLMQPDGDGDTVMHQIVEFGRKESLEVLMPVDRMERQLLVDALHVQNKHGETPLELLEHFEDSTTIRALKADGILTEEHLVIARQNLSSIQDSFVELEPPRSGMRM